MTSSDWFLLVYNLIYPKRACRLLITMETKSCPTSYYSAKGADNANQSQEGRQWRHFGDRETVRHCPYYRTFLSMSLAADKVFLYWLYLFTTRLKRQGIRLASQRYKVIHLAPYTIEVTLAGVAGMPATSITVLRCYRELARAHWSPWHYGNPTLTPMLTDEVHQQLHNGI